MHRTNEQTAMTGEILDTEAIVMATLSRILLGPWGQKDKRLPRKREEDQGNLDQGGERRILGFYFRPKATEPQ